MNFNSFIRRLFPRGEKKHSIDPDEIFLDSSNLPEFDENQFEGRIVRPISKLTIGVLGGVFVLVGLLFISKIWILQVAEGQIHAEQSERNRLKHSLLFADRGVVVDRNGTELIWNTLYEGEDFSRRSYISDKGFAHLLGYISYPLKDSSGVYYSDAFTGKDGIELSLTSSLSGSNGVKIVETDARFAVQSESVIRPPTSGEDIVLSIDARVQKQLHTFIEERASDAGFQGGAGVIMDVTTGEILALTSYPEYDPEILSEGEAADVLVSYQRDERKPFLNRVVSGLYTPGSTIKPFVALGVLEEGLISPEKEILSTGSISVPNPYFPDQPSIFRDWKAHGLVNLSRALAMSSNVYFYAVGGGFGDQDGLGISGIEKYMRFFGFGGETGVDLSIEGMGTIPSPTWKEQQFDGEPWRLGDTYHTAIGQYGFQVTPIQMVRAVAAVANEGILLTPTLVLGEEGKREKIPIAKKHFPVIKEGMRLAVTEGTAQGLSVPDVAVAAKTGTAELGARKEFVNSWITGFFPYENPRYAFVILMEHGPEENLVGGLFVMRQLLDWMRINAPEYIEVR